MDEHADAPFRQCLARNRIQRAAELLAEASIPVRDIAARVGYRQPAQFAKAFARVHSAASLARTPSPSAARAQPRTARDGSRPRTLPVDPIVAAHALTAHQEGAQRPTPETRHAPVA